MPSARWPERSIAICGRVVSVSGGPLGPGGAEVEARRDEGVDSTARRYGIHEAIVDGEDVCSK